MFFDFIYNDFDLTPEEGSALERFSTKPIKMIEEIVDDDLKIDFKSMKFKDVNLLEVNDPYRSYLKDRIHSYPSSSPLGVCSAKKIIEVLIEEEFNVAIVGLDYSTTRDDPYNIILEISRGDEQCVGIITMLNILRQKDSIPVKYKKYLSQNKVFYISNYTNMFFNGDYFETFKNLFDKIRANAVLPNGLSDFQKPTVEVLSTMNGQLITQEVEIDGNVMSDEELALHYGDDFVKFENIFISRLAEKTKGVALLHGPPGNGKTYFIRHVISKLKDKRKRVIVIPKHVLAEFESPSFNSFLLEEFASSEQQAVFIVEDAEAAISARDNEGDGRAVVSTILNLSDGLLNDIFKVQLICTFNTDLENIDQALLRKGRLIAQKMFMPLSVENAQRLVDHLKLDYEVKEELPLSEIYSIESEDEDAVLMGSPVSKKKNKIGFFSKEEREEISSIKKKGII